MYVMINDFYEIMEVEKYYYNIKKVDIENCGDVWYDKNELEYMGIGRSVGYGRNEGKELNKELVKNELFDCVSKIKECGKSVVLDSELVEVLKKNNICVRDYDSRFKRVGNRLFVENVEEIRLKKLNNRKVKYSDWKNLLRCFVVMLMKKGLCLELNNGMIKSSIDSVNVVKSMCSFEEIVNDIEFVSEKDIEFMKKVYDENDIEFVKR